MHTPTPHLHIGVFCAASDHLAPEYYDMATQFGQWMGGRGHTLVYGGASAGLMEATAKAVRQAGGRVVGIVPHILEERHRVSTLLTEKVPCRDLTDRKALLIDRSDVMVALPGGIGTLDEVFTAMAAHSIGYHHKPVVLFDTNGFWHSLEALLQDYARLHFLNAPLHTYLYTAHSIEELEGLLHTIIPGTTDIPDGKAQE